MFYYFLGPDDKILANDEVRDTVLKWGYGDVPINRECIDWGKVEDRMPAWVGSTLREYSRVIVPSGPRAISAQTGQRIYKVDIEIRRLLTPFNVRQLEKSLVKQIKELVKKTTG